MTWCWCHRSTLVDYINQGSLTIFFPSLFIVYSIFACTNEPILFHFSLFLILNLQLLKKSHDPIKWCSQATHDWQPPHQKPSHSTHKLTAKCILFIKIACVSATDASCAVINMAKQMPSVMKFCDRIGGQGKKANVALKKTLLNIEEEKNSIRHRFQSEIS